MQINAARLKRNMEILGEFGRQSSGGITRLVFSPAYIEAVRWLAKRMTDAGLEVIIDPASNVIGRLNGEPSDQIIGIGSHIDTVPHGGMFDGAMGVLTALEVAQTLIENTVKLRYPIEVVGFADEEGARFGFGLLGSRSFTGTVKLEAYRVAKDREGVSVPDAMAAAGFGFERLPAARRDLSQFLVFLEIHVEQGPILEQNNCPIGIVTAIAGSRRFKLQIHGESRHGGSTPMDVRKDALWGAADVITIVREVVVAAGGCQVGTAGAVNVVPNVANVIPGEATVVFEVRDVDGPALDRTIEEILRQSWVVCEGYGLDVKASAVSERPPIPMDKQLQDLLRATCERLGIGQQPIASMGGHDCMVFAPQVPIAMLFVPSRGGYSHSPKEWTDWEYVFTGANVLLQAVLDLQGR